ncbi:aldehyde dehydrogenase family protein [Kitasatospora aureofaciens]|uniref:aldehyde dehydrogenase family protein n=1 Tax=Kitasatospora aureofaciens TaxID=1894 RepID=UPI0037CC24D8
MNPATERVLATVPAGGAADVDAAVTAARRAAPGWAATTRFLQCKSPQYRPARARGCRTALRQPLVVVGPRRPGQTRSTPG